VPDAQRHVKSFRAKNKTIKKGERKMLRGKKTKTLIILATALLLLTVYAAAMVKAEDTQQTAKIWTDKADYSPEETVKIFGTGFLPESTITIEVTRPDLTVESWNATSDSDGNFTTTYLLDGITGTYTVAATDENGNRATTTFTDLSIDNVYACGSSYPPAKSSFLTSEDVYAFVDVSGGSSKTVDIYVVNSPLSAGDITDVSGGVETVTVSTSNKGPFMIWAHPTKAGNYYVVVDANQNGKYAIGEKTYAFSITADTTPPDTSITAGPTDWIKVQSATFTWTGSDDITATANLVYSWKLDGGAWSAYSSATTTTVTGLSEGSHTFEVRAKDEAGNVDPTPATRSFSVDITAPTLTKNLAGTAGSNGWYTSNVEVTLTGSDTGGSGLASVEYRLNGGDWTTYTAPFTISTEGENTLEHRATDNAGNVYVLDAQTIKIDKTAPTTSLTIGTPNSGTDPTYISTTTTFTLSASDSTSGVDYIQYQFTTHGGSLGSWQTYSISFTAPGTGSYDLYYRSVDKAGNVETAKKVWVMVGATKLTYTGATSGQYSDPVTVSATLIDLATGDPIQGKSISFEISTTPSLTASDDTDYSGIASASITLLRPSGTYMVYASFVGDNDYLPSSDSDRFTINKETVTIAYTGDTFVFTAGPGIPTAPVRLSAILTQEADGYPGDLTLAKVTFVLTPVDSGSPITVSGVPVNSLGEVLTTCTVSVGAYFVDVRVELDNQYWESGFDSSALTVEESTGTQKVTGGGWIPDPLSANGKGNFGFTVQYQKKGAPTGSFVYVFRGTDGYIYKVKSNSWQGGGLWFTGNNKAYFMGKCTVQKIDSTTGLVVESWGNYKFIVDIKDGDLDKPRTADTFALTILTNTGVVWRQIGTPANQIELGGGNIVVHSK
jgi:hypothetical protein